MEAKARDFGAALWECMTVGPRKRRNGNGCGHWHVKNNDKGCRVGMDVVLGGWL